MKFLLFVLVAIGLSATVTSEAEILSKEDARMVFSLSETEWNNQVRQATALGAGSHEPIFGGTLKQVIPMGDTQLSVLPTYGGDKRTPDAIVITVSFASSNPAYRVNASGSNSMCEKVFLQIILDRSGSRCWRSLRKEILPKTSTLLS